jgi:hypothetical protein
MRKAVSGVLQVARNSDPVSESPACRDSELVEELLNPAIHDTPLSGSPREDMLISNLPKMMGKRCHRGFSAAYAADLKTSTIRNDNYPVTNRAGLWLRHIPTAVNTTAVVWKYFAISRHRASKIPDRKGIGSLLGLKAIRKESRSERRWGEGVKCNAFVSIIRQRGPAVLDHDRRHGHFCPMRRGPRFKIPPADSNTGLGVSIHGEMLREDTRNSS